MSAGDAATILRLERDAAVGRGVAGERSALLVLEEPDRDDRRLEVPLAFLPITLARIMGLSPRPPRDDAAPVRVPAAALALALAGAEMVPALAPVLRAGAPPPRRWLVEGAREDDVRRVEALDTEGGLWLVMADGADVALAPVTPTQAFRLLVALVAWR